MNLLKLRSRGVLLVMFPLICQIIFVGVLLNSLNDMQSELLIQSKSRRVIAGAHEFTLGLLHIFTKAYFEQGSGSHNMFNKKEALDEANKLKKPFHQLVKMLREDPDQTENSKSLEQTANQLGDLEIQIGQAQNQGWEHWKTVRRAYDHMIYEGLSSMLDQITDLISVEESKEATHPALSVEFRSKVATILIFALVLSTAITIALAIIFAMTIRNPLKHVEENARKMSLRQNLLPELRGADEISELDRTLHSVATAFEKELLKEELLIDNAPNMVCTFNSDGKIIRLNQAVQRLLGWSFQSLIQTYILDLVVLDDLTVAEEEFRMTKSNGVGSFDLRLKKRNGEWADTRWECLYSPATKDTFAVIRDVTQEKNVERLKQDFLDMITHDLRSPLASIHGSMTMIAEGVRGEIPDDVKKDVNTAIGTVDHLMSFVNDLLDFQKLKAGRMQITVDRVRLDSLIKEAISLLEDYARDKKVSVKLDCGGIAIDCDRTKIIQVVTNLLSNAIKFSPPSASVEVKVTETDETVTVHVLDWGPGIPEHLLTKIFEAFEQVPDSPKSSEGTGLGLAISKLVVEAHGGTIAADNWDNGSDFSFSIPRTQINHEQNG